MIISHRFKFIFVKTVKTAGTSIEVYLNSLLGPDDVATPVIPAIDGFQANNHRGLFNPVPEIVARPRTIRTSARDLFTRQRYYNHLPGYKIRARAGRHLWDEYFTFCVERNPWDKTVSYFSMINARAGGLISWEEFLSGSRHCTNILHYVDPRDRSKVIVDRILRYERLDDDLAEVFDRLGVPFDGELGVRAKSGYRTDDRDFRSWFNGEQRDRVSQLFSEEIRLLGYTFNGV